MKICFLNCLQCQEVVALGRLRQELKASLCYIVQDSLTYIVRPSSQKQTKNQIAYDVCCVSVEK